MRKQPVQVEGPDTAGAHKQNRSFYNPHCWPFRQHGRCSYRPNSHQNPYQGFTRASGVVTPEPPADAAGHPIRLGTSSGGERLFWWVSFLTSSSNVRTNIEQIFLNVNRKMMPASAGGEYKQPDGKLIPIFNCSGTKSKSCLW